MIFVSFFFLFCVLGHLYLERRKNQQLFLGKGWSAQGYSCHMSIPCGGQQSCGVHVLVTRSFMPYVNPLWGSAELWCSCAGHKVIHAIPQSLVGFSRALVIMCWSSICEEYRIYG